MGSTSDTNTHITKKGKINALEAFKSLIETRIKLYDCNKVDDFYIIKAESIPKFIEIIKKPECEKYITDKKKIKILIKI